MFLAKFLASQGGQCLPHMLWKRVAGHIDGGTSQIPTNNKCQLLLDWCLAAAQANTDDTSILNLRTTETALSQDPEFLEWCELRLTATLRQEPKQARLTGGNKGKGTIKIIEWIASEMGRSFMAGVQALAPSIAGAAHQGSGYGMEVMSDNLGGKMYSLNNVVALKGYCGVVDARDIKVIWDAFQHMKEIVSHQHNLHGFMLKWALLAGGPRSLHN
jgi:hypothetical protein